MDCFWRFFSGLVTLWSETGDSRPHAVAAVVKDFVDVRNLLGSEPRLARTVLAKHMQKIVLVPQGSRYVAIGDWKLLGLGSYGGAGGPAWTERLPIRFEWLAAA